MQTGEERREHAAKMKMEMKEVFEMTGQRKSSKPERLRKRILAAPETSEKGFRSTKN